MIKPKNLKPGSRIAVISPSSGLPSIFPEIYELGLKNLQELFGFEIVEMKTARMDRTELYKNPRLRAEDINDAFRDESIDGIICSIGGYESVRILPYLDIENIVKNPKVIMGFSDATTFLTYLNNHGMVTFYGPSIMAGIAQLKSITPRYAQHMKEILCGTDYPYEYRMYDKWTNGYKDWSDVNVLGQCTEFFNNKDGVIVLQGTGQTEGVLWGGCMEVLEFMKGTSFWPKESFWQDKILFFETSEDKPLPFNVGYMLRNYGMQGILGKIKGLMFGRPKDYSEEEKKELYEVVQEIVSGEFGVGELPIFMNTDFGHTDPKIILPLGGRVRLDADKKTITLIENPFEI
jgi:Uncharacterized proteins, homologs of microcin C7 resistance protein MccF